MALTLTVLRCPPTVAPEVREVTGGEFSIGRGPDNQWVLPDPTKHLSKRHCVLAFRNGIWQVAGTGTNGTFVNRDEVPLESRGPRTLEDGDRLILGVYEIESAWSRRPSHPGDDPCRLLTRGETRSAIRSTTICSPPAHGAIVDRPEMPIRDLRWIPIRRHSHRTSIHCCRMTRRPSRDERPPTIVRLFQMDRPAAGKVPDDWDLDDFAPPPVAKPLEREAARRPVGVRPALPERMSALVRPATPPAVPPAEGDLFAAFLRGAGMGDVALPNPVETMERLGAAFRATVSGIRHALIARSEVKREFRIETTMIRTRGNNLLKFSANDDDALAGLLGAGRHTDMGPEEAVTEALTDIRLHELASMTAMQAAVRALVVRLGPDQIRDAKDNTANRALLEPQGTRLGRLRGAPCRVLRGLSDDFDSVFGKRFALAYEQAMEELTRRKRPGDDWR